MRKSFLLVVGLSLFTMLSACGGGSGTQSNGTVLAGSNGQMIRVLSPSEGAMFAPGAEIQLQLETENFMLAVPFNLRALLRHGVSSDSAELEALEQAAIDQGYVEASHDHSDEEGHSDEEEDVTDDHSVGETSESEESHEHEHGTDADHSHDSDAMNHTADEGHYHIYLDDASGTDAHLTAWTTEVTYQLPEGVSPGTHSLRIELRDNSHVLVGAETVFFFEIEE
ncbi:MAG: hypothetical protein KDD70_09475 [Bdellovibrionales bacterium]|nr:hypothetical protein [Bdellovibrionales bacterium]